MSGEYSWRIPNAWVVTEPHPVEGFDFTLGEKMSDWCIDHLGYVPMVESRVEYVPVGNTNRKMRTDYFVVFFEDDSAATCFKLSWLDAIADG